MNKYYNTNTKKHENNTKYLFLDFLVIHLFYSHKEKRKVNKKNIPVLDSWKLWFCGIKILKSKLEPQFNQLLTTKLTGLDHIKLILYL